MNNNNFFLNRAKQELIIHPKNDSIAKNNKKHKKENSTNFGLTAKGDCIVVQNFTACSLNNSMEKLILEIETKE